MAGPQIRSAQIADGAIVTSKIDAGAVVSTSIASSAIGSSKMAASGVDRVQSDTPVLTRQNVVAGLAPTSAATAFAVPATSINSTAVGYSSTAEGAIGSSVWTAPSAGVKNLVDIRRNSDKQQVETVDGIGVFGRMEHTGATGIGSGSWNVHLRTWDPASGVETAWPFNATTVGTSKVEIAFTKRSNLQSAGEDVFVAPTRFMSNVADVEEVNRLRRIYKDMYTAGYGATYSSAAAFPTAIRPVQTHIPNTDEKAAMTNASSPSASNPFATLDDIPTALPPSGAAGGDLSGTYPDPVVAQLQGVLPISATHAGIATGALFFYNGSKMVAQWTGAAIASNEVPRWNAAAAAYEAASGIAPAAHGTTHEPGNSDEIFPWATASDLAQLGPAGGTGSAGTGTGALVRPDHQHPIKFATASVIASLGGVTAAAGSVTSFAHADHKHALSYGTAGQLTNVGDTKGAGASNNIARADHAHGVDWATVGELGTLGATGAAGSGTSVARGDHIHPVTWGTVGDIQGAGTASGGATNKFARVDHIHPIPTGSAVVKPAYTLMTSPSGKVAFAIGTAPIAVSGVDDLLCFRNGQKMQQVASGVTPTAQNVFHRAGTGIKLHFTAATAEVLEAFYHYA